MTHHFGVINYGADEQSIKTDYKNMGYLFPMHFLVVAILSGLVLGPIGLVHGLGLQINSSLTLYGASNFNSFGIICQYHNNSLLISATRYPGTNQGALYGYNVDLTNGLSVNSTFQKYGAAGNYLYSIGTSINPDNQLFFVGATGDNSAKGVVYVYDLYSYNLLYNISGNYVRLGRCISSYQSYVVIRDSNGIFVYNFTRSGANFLYNLTYTGLDVVLDNNYLVVGADTGGINSGNVYIHHLGNGSLIKQINETQSINFRFGYHVSVQYPYLAASAPFPGNGYVFVYDMSNNYQRIAMFTGLNSGERFGYSISVKSNGLLLVGAYAANSSAGRTDLYDFLSNTSSIYSWYGNDIGIQSGYSVFIYDDILIIHEENAPNSTVQYGSAIIYQYQYDRIMTTTSTTGMFTTTAEMSGALTSSTGIVSFSSTTSNLGIQSISSASELLSCIFM